MVSHNTHWSYYALRDGMVDLCNDRAIFPTRRFFRKFRYELFYGRFKADKFITGKKDTYINRKILFCLWYAKDPADRYHEVETAAFLKNPNCWY